MNVADHMICSVYGDHLHCNGSTNLDRGLVNDELWQRLCWNIENTSMRWLTLELKGVWIRGWNYDLPLVFDAFIFSMTYKTRSSKGICVCIEHRMYLWYQSHFVELVDDTINDKTGGIGGPIQGVSVVTQEERAPQAYNHTVLSGLIRQTVWGAMSLEGGGVLMLYYVCTKIGRPVRELIQ